jgi:hypothetical protein
MNSRNLTMRAAEELFDKIRPTAAASNDHGLPPNAIEKRQSSGYAGGHVIRPDET